jgi:hypothetical protein
VGCGVAQPVAPGCLQPFLETCRQVMPLLTNLNNPVSCCTGRSCPAQAGPP